MQHCWQKQEEILPRKWHPKSDKDYPHCKAGVRVSIARVNQAITPNCSQKQKEGARKRRSMEGYACPGRDCAYFGVTGEAMHALVGYGKMGKNNNIQRWRCQACRTTFSCRRRTVLNYLKSDPAQVEMTKSYTNAWLRYMPTIKNLSNSLKTVFLYHSNIVVDNRKTVLDFF